MKTKLISVLVNQDDALKQIEQKAREEQSVWSQQLNQSEEKTRQLEKDNSRLREERKTLESTIKELQSLQETFVDMEEKLKDLQLKLQGEDAAKRELTLKYDEVRLEDSLTSHSSCFQGHCSVEV
jgi:predicted RNase H-like nuclease (RuvC/YqgF family)